MLPHKSSSGVDVPLVFFKHALVCKFGKIEGNLICPSLHGEKNNYYYFVDHENTTVLSFVLPGFSFLTHLSSWTRPDTPPGLETMATKLAKKVAVKAPSATSTRTSPQKAGDP